MYPSKSELAIQEYPGALLSNKIIYIELLATSNEC